MRQFLYTCLSFPQHSDEKCFRSQKQQQQHQQSQPTPMSQNAMHSQQSQFGDNDRKPTFIAHTSLSATANNFPSDIYKTEAINSNEVRNVYYGKEIPQSGSLYSKESANTNFAEQIIRFTQD